MFFLKKISIVEPVQAGRAKINDDYEIPSFEVETMKNESLALELFRNKEITSLSFQYMKRMHSLQLVLHIDSKKKVGIAMDIDKYLFSVAGIFVSHQLAVYHTVLGQKDIIQIKLDAVTKPYYPTWTGVIIPDILQKSMIKHGTPLSELPQRTKLFIDKIESDWK